MEDDHQRPPDAIVVPRFLGELGARPEQQYQPSGSYSLAVRQWVRNLTSVYHHHEQEYLRLDRLHGAGLGLPYDTGAEAPAVHGRLVLDYRQVNGRVSHHLNAAEIFGRTITADRIVLDPGASFSWLSLTDTFSRYNVVFGAPAINQLGDHLARLPNGELNLPARLQQDRGPQQYHWEDDDSTTASTDSGPPPLVD